MRRSRGSIHGRFQPFHNGHLRYALAALDQVDFLYVGLTRIFSEPSAIESAAPHRLRATSNPLTYSERSDLIRLSLRNAGVPAERFEIGPFPIEKVERLPEFFPTDFPCFTTIVDDWNREKIALLKHAGYEVVVLVGEAWADDAIGSGTMIRQLIADGDEGWRRYIPEGGRDRVAALIKAGRF